MVTVGERLKLYGKNTNLHGLCYVVDEGRNPLLRLLWLLVFLASFAGMLVVFKSSYDSFLDNAISFATETTYLGWNTTFPAVTICEITSSEITWDEEESDDEDRSLIMQFMSDIIFFTGSCYSCSSDCRRCESFNFRDVVEKNRKSCEKLLEQCKWNGAVFPCCEKFLPLESEYGVCFSFNSLHTRKKLSASDIYKSNSKTGPGELIIQSKDDVRLYLHAPEDVPFINSDPDHRKDVMLGEIYNITFNVIEIENDENVKYLAVEKRICRFPWEKTANLLVHDHYSYSTCIVQCHADAHIRLCNCTHHLMPVLGKEHYCDIQGLQCLTDNYETVNRLHAKGFDKPGLVCDCVPSCVEPEYKLVSDTKGVKASYSEVKLKMQSLPTFRFKRNVVRTTLDLVVSIGGSAGLFIGASLLSIVEVFYFFFLRR